MNAIAIAVPGAILRWSIIFGVLFVIAGSNRILEMSKTLTRTQRTISYCVGTGSILFGVVVTVFALVQWYYYFFP